MRYTTNLITYSDQCHTSRVPCQKGPTRHGYAWQIEPFWQDTVDMTDHLPQAAFLKNASDLLTATWLMVGTVRSPQAMNAKCLSIYIKYIPSSFEHIYRELCTKGDVRSHSGFTASTAKISIIWNSTPNTPTFNEYTYLLSPRWHHSKRPTFKKSRCEVCYHITWLVTTRQKSRSRIMNAPRESWSYVKTSYYYLAIISPQETKTVNRYFVFTMSPGNHRFLHCYCAHECRPYCFLMETKLLQT